MKRKRKRSVNPKTFTPPEPLPELVEPIDFVAVMDTILRSGPAKRKKLRKRKRATPRR